MDEEAPKMDMKQFKCVSLAKKINNGFFFYKLGPLKIRCHYCDVGGVNFEIFIKKR